MGPCACPRAAADGGGPGVQRQRGLHGAALGGGDGAAGGAAPAARRGRQRQCPERPRCARPSDRGHARHSPASGPPLRGKQARRR
eukprot:scaffold5823_cov295-Prasinococcus_capsulatus_cf.AAC.5